MVLTAAIEERTLDKELGNLTSSFVTLGKQFILLGA